MAVLIKPFTDFPDKNFSPCARKIWREFFARSSEDTDVAYWVIDANSASIKVYVRSSGEDVLADEWSGNMPIITAANGVIERLESKSKNASNTHREFRQWAEHGIMEAFEQKQVQTWFKKSPVLQSQFNLVSTMTDNGFAEDDLDLLWQSNKSFGLDEMRDNHRKANRKRPGKRLGKRLAKRKK